jgi:hypothetical protein
MYSCSNNENERGTSSLSEGDEDYLFMFRRAQEKDSENFPWILTNLTLNQMEQIQKTWWTELFTATRETMKKLFELMTYK